MFDDFAGITFIILFEVFAALVYTRFYFISLIDEILLNL